MINLKLKYQLQYEELRVYKTRTGVHYKSFREKMGTSAIRRAFRNKFYPKIPRKVQHANAFARVMDRLKNHGSSHFRLATGKEPIFVETVVRVKNLFTVNNRSHFR